MNTETAAKAMAKIVRKVMKENTYGYAPIYNNKRKTMRSMKCYLRSINRGVDLRSKILAALDLYEHRQNVNVKIIQREGSWSEASLIVQLQYA